MADPGRLLAVLAATPLLQGLPAATLERVAGRSGLRSYPRGQVLFRSGDPGDTLLVVGAGQVQVSTHSADGAELILAVMTAPDILGELGVVDGGPRSASASTLEPTELAVLPRAVVLELLDEHHTVARRLLAAVAASLRRRTEATADLVFLDLPRRLAKLLLERPREPDGTVALGPSQSHLAAHIGGTRQSVNAALKAFERRGWLALDGRHVALLDEAALRRFAGLPPLGRTP